MTFGELKSLMMTKGFQYRPKPAPPGGLPYLRNQLNMQRVWNPQQGGRMVTVPHGQRGKAVHGAHGGQGLHPGLAVRPKHTRAAAHKDFLGVHAGAGGVHAVATSTGEAVLPQQAVQGMGGPQGGIGAHSLLPMRGLLQRQRGQRWAAARRDASAGVGAEVGVNTSGGMDRGSKSHSKVGAEALSEAQAEGRAAGGGGSGQGQAVVGGSGAGPRGPHTGGRQTEAATVRQPGRTDPHFDASSEAGAGQTEHGTQWQPAAAAA